MNTTKNNTINNTKKSVQRALSHAQGQLLRHHKNMLLFFALDILEYIREKGLLTNAQESFSKRLKIGDRQSSMFAWELNNAIEEARTELENIAIFCEKQTNKQSNFRRAWVLSEAMNNYIKMAGDLQNPKGLIFLKQATKINPFTSATFLAEYMMVIADKLEQKATKENDAYFVYSGRLTALRSKIMNNTPKEGKPLHKTGAQDIGALYNIMTLMSEAADLSQSITKFSENREETDKKLMQSLDYLFQTAATYDWQQYETHNEKPRSQQKPAVILKLRPS